MLFLFFPFMYTFHTRLNSNVNKVAWFFTYLMPVAILFFSIARLSNEVVFDDFIIFFISVSIVYSIYEFGYLENDTETIKRELNPTLRLSNSELKFSSEHKSSIIFFRGALIFFLTCTLAYQSIPVEKIYYFYFSQLLLYLIFRVYNRVRSRVNLLLQFLLSTLRYFSPLLLVMPMANLADAFVFVFVFPVLNIIEWTTKERFMFSLMYPLKERIPLVRVIYYFIVFLSGAFFFESNYFNLTFKTVILYFLFYRIISYVVFNVVLKKTK